MDKNFLNEILATLKFFDLDLQKFILENLFAEYMSTKQIKDLYKVKDLYKEKNICKVKDLYKVKTPIPINKQNSIYRHKLRYLLKSFTGGSCVDPSTISYILKTDNYKYALSLIQNGMSRIEILLKVFLLAKLSVEKRDKRFLFCAWQLAKEFGFKKLFRFINYLYQNKAVFGC